MLKNRIKELIKNDKGYVIVEVTLSLIVIIALFIGYLTYTNAVRYKLVMSMAAKEGARTYMVTRNKYNDISKSRQDAIDKAESELTIGGVPGADVIIDGDEVIIEKPYGFYIPITDSYMFNLRVKAEFHEEEKLDFYY